MLRIVLFLPLFFMLGCTTTRPAAPAPSGESSAGTILTVILEVNPKLDTLTVFDVIRGPGRLRADFAATAEPAAGDLLFSFVGAEGKILRQTTRPYPAANRYEGPGDDGKILTAELPDEPRSLVLKTQASQRLQWLIISGELPVGKGLNQRINLRAKN